MGYSSGRVKIYEIVNGMTEEKEVSENGLVENLKTIFIEDALP
ncbi:MULTISPECIES: hypothetical protein [Metallosphaera]|nr:MULTISPECIES: hypothetical protein [Metallosphaera]WPX07354.1 hypothetical protein SOJ17_001116 [Metallosphaera sedula DSM 5348]BBL47200.1 hypothetical protein MJ1HA_1301 [Metallosphaera sedula]